MDDGRYMMFDLPPGLKERIEQRHRAEDQRRKEGNWWLHFPHVQDPCPCCKVGLLTITDYHLEGDVYRDHDYFSAHCTNAECRRNVGQRPVPRKLVWALEENWPDGCRLTPSGWVGD